MDAINSALTKANKLTIAYKDLESKFQLTAQQGIDLGKQFDTEQANWESERTASDKTIKRLKTGRNFWRTVAVVLGVALGSTIAF